MDNSSLSFMLTQNTSTNKDWVKMVFDECKAEINQMREKNAELTDSLEFSQHDIE